MTPQEKLKKLIKALVSEHSERNIMFELYQQVKAQENGFINEFNEAQAFNLNLEGYIVVKADTQKEQTQITELLQTVIVNHNDQQAKLFSN
jgi:hypothetical protein